jgi:hypothetical protein
MTVTFDLWGASELLMRLSAEQHAGRRWFWFGRTELSPAWFADRPAEVIDAAGPRIFRALATSIPTLST